MPVDSDGKLIKDSTNLSFLSKIFPQAPWGQSRCNSSQPLIMQALSEREKKRGKEYHNGSERMKEAYVGNRDCCRMIRKQVSLIRRKEKLSYFCSLFLLPWTCVSLEMRHKSFKPEKAFNPAWFIEFHQLLFLNHSDKLDYCFLQERRQLSWKQSLAREDYSQVMMLMTQRIEW